MTNHKAFLALFVNERRYAIRVTMEEFKRMCEASEEKVVETMACDSRRPAAR